MDDKEIMKQFEEAFGLEKKEPAPTYKATRNLNTEIANPNVNINDSRNINIINENVIEQSNDIKLDLTESLNNSFNNNMPNISDENIKKKDFILAPEEKKEYKIEPQPAVYQPTFKGKKRTNLKLSPELLISMIIAFVLLVFILFMPSISDFFREIKLGLRR